MGNGVTRPNLQEFAAISNEYDKFKAAGLSKEEMYFILNKRISEGKISSEPAYRYDMNNNMAMIPTNTNNFNAFAQFPADNSYNHFNQPTFSVNAKSFAGYDKEDVARPAQAVGSNSVGSSQQMQLKPSLLVLLIDDSAVAVKVASKVLSNFNFEIVTANSAKAGYEILLARGNDIKLIFLDVVMPVTDGVECLGWIKDNADIAHIPVYMLSGLEDNMLNDVCIERGAEGMLLKPLNADTVAEILQTHQIGSFATEKTKELALKKTVEVDSRGEMKITTKRESFSNPVDPLLSATCVQEGGLAPAFRLCDDQFNDCVYPDGLSKECLLVFLPTVFFKDLFTEDGIMNALYRQGKMLMERGIDVLCITPDPPFAIRSAKEQFEIPFRMLSDPGLVVINRYIGNIDIGRIMAQPSDDDDDDIDPIEAFNNALHPMNRFVGSNLGLTLLNNNREVIKIWKATCEDAEDNVLPVRNTDFYDYPKNIFDWVKSGIIEHQRKSDITLDLARKSVDKTISGARSSELSKSLSAPSAESKTRSKEDIFVMVVDDSSVSSRVASKKIKNLGLTVFCAYNGQLAYEMLQKDPKKYSVILTDVMMPIVDGISLLRMCKENSSLKHIPVVMLSGVENDKISQECINLGAVDVMNKPFDEKRFEKILQAVNIFPSEFESK